MGNIVVSTQTAFIAIIAVVAIFLFLIFVILTLRFSIRQEHRITTYVVSGKDAIIENMHKLAQEMNEGTHIVINNFGDFASKAAKTLFGGNKRIR